MPSLACWVVALLELEEVEGALELEALPLEAPLACARVSWEHYAIQTLPLGVRLVHQIRLVPEEEGARLPEVARAAVRISLSNSKRERILQVVSCRVHIISIIEDRASAERRVNVPFGVIIAICAVSGLSEA